ncbi:MAG: GNAT family N-acetyltransferase [Alphaproteobacteria bacterium]|nr:MAG: GNAT family N-acetyltransferase [Alphaproteobacteria bacterium]
MHSLEIRAATPSDKTAIGDLIVPIQRTEFGIDISYEDQPDLADIEGFYQSRDGGFWVAVADGHIVGTIGMKDIGAGQGALRKMFVAAGYRGRDHGVAQALLDHLLTHARTRGMNTILLGTTAKFLAAHRFYEKNGFTRVDVADLPESFPRMAVDTRFYRLDV